MYILIAYYKAATLRTACTSPCLTCRHLSVQGKLRAKTRIGYIGTSVVQGFLRSQILGRPIHRHTAGNLQNHLKVALTYLTKICLMPLNILNVLKITVKLSITSFASA
jgi:hypothetical protein